MWQPSQRQMALKNTNRTPAGAGCPPSNCYAVTHYITRRSAHPKQGMLALYPCGLHRYLLRSSSPAETLGRLARHSNRNQLRPSRTLPLQVGITRSAADRLPKTDFNTATQLQPVRCRVWFTETSYPRHEDHHDSDRKLRRQTHANEVGSLLRGCEPRNHTSKSPSPLRWPISSASRVAECVLGDRD